MPCARGGRRPLCQGNCDRLDTSDSLFNRVARDLNVDMKNHWRPDAAFLATSQLFASNTVTSASYIMLVRLNRSMQGGERRQRRPN
jgi:hypothetical protein